MNINYLIDKIEIVQLTIFNSTFVSLLLPLL